MSFLTAWLEHYGYGILFIALFLEMLALPLPGEVLLSYAGLLVFQGKLSLPLAILLAGAGASAGMTLSYWIGFRLGKPFFEKYGARFHMGPDKLDKVSHWFQKYGNVSLMVAYFIPGVRHITGYFSGTTRLSFRKYAAFAYSGAFLWVGVFLTLGKLLGPKWELYHHTINRYLLIGGIGTAFLLIMVYFYRNRREEWRARATLLLEKGLTRFHTAGNVRFLLISAFAVLVGFLSLAIGMIQDFLAQEFSMFDEIATFLIGELFSSGWSVWMNRFAMLGTYYFWGPLILVTALWILLKGKERRLELSFLGLVVLGGEALDEGLRYLFHRTGPLPSGLRDPYTFPSEQSLLSLIVVGIAVYLGVRHYGGVKLRMAGVLSVILISLLVGITRIYFGIQYPSDVAAGFAFGGVWLSLNVVLLEIFRLLSERSRQA
ncbi:VTT domain-containing protein [Paenibacillus sp. CC-CFT747]|nr:VTT domain-containing protein [Paenibacillus sp. CC-CFT747]